MKSVYRVLVLAVLALACGPLLAQSTLGQIQVKSALGQPLDAVIALHPDYPGEFDQLQVQLAPAAAFQRAGIDRSALKVKLKFKLAVAANGQKVIRVSTAEPVREPYLDFVLKLNWPRGQMLREYVVLLDPVASNVVSNSSSVPPAYGPGSQSGQQAGAQSAPKTAPPVASAQPRAQAPAQSAGSVTIQHGDTLSGVAFAHSLDGVSYQQMLLALKATNPDAFFRDNVNALKAGAVLRIPTRSQALTLSRTAATAAVRAQNQAWQQAHGGAPTLVAHAGGSTAPLASPGGQGSDRLSLVPPAKDAGGGNQTGNDGAASASQLRRELARSQEALSSQKQSAADLQSRVQALEHIAEQNKQLLSLKNDQIAQLQKQLAAAREQAGLPALPASATTPAQLASATSVAPAAAGSVVAAETAVAGTSALATVPGVAGATAAQPKAQTKPAAASKPEPAAKPQVTKTTNADFGTPWYEQLWARVVLVVIIVLLIVWALLRRRKAAGRQRRPSIAHHFADSPLEADAATGEPTTEDDLDAGAAEPTREVVADDGEQELLAELAEHPDDVGLHLELVSLYYARQDVERFEGAAEAMHAYVDDETAPEWLEVLTMGRVLDPEHPWFASEAAQQAQDSATVDDPFDPGPGLMATDAEDGVVATDDAGANESAHGMDWDDAAASEPASAGSALNEAEAPAPADPMDWEWPSESTGTTHLTDDLDGPASIAADADDPVATDDFGDSAAEDVSTGEGGVEPSPAEASEYTLDELPDVDVEDTLAPAADAGTVATSATDLGDDYVDDPVDTKLDLARAYIDMGDHEGAEAMLNEVLAEGSQMQKDTARQLLQDMD